MSIDFLRFPDFKRKAVTFSYDDNTQWDKCLIEIMVKHGLKGTFNVNSGLLALRDGDRKLTALNSGTFGDWHKPRYNEL